MSKESVEGKKKSIIPRSFIPPFKKKDVYIYIFFLASIPLKDFDLYNKQTSYETEKYLRAGNKQEDISFPKVSFKRQGAFPKHTL